MHEYHKTTLHHLAQQRIHKQMPFEEEELWEMVEVVVRAGRAMLEAGGKEPVLSPVGIKMREEGSWVVGEWEIGHFYEAEGEAGREEETHLVDE